MTMFKITNFEHVGVDLLHDQLERWRSGERPVENLMIVSRADWNGANSNAGQDTQEVFKDTNFLFLKRVVPEISTTFAARLRIAN